MGAQLSTKAALPLAEILARASDRCSNTRPSTSNTQWLISTFLQACLGPSIRLPCSLGRGRNEAQLKTAPPSGHRWHCWHTHRSEWNSGRETGESVVTAAGTLWTVMEGWKWPWPAGPTDNCPQAFSIEFTLDWDSHILLDLQSTVIRIAVLDATLLDLQSTVIRISVLDATLRTLDYCQVSVTVWLGVETDIVGLYGTLKISMK